MTDERNPVDKCIVCGEPAYGLVIPMFSGLVLHNGCQGDWDSPPACRRCVETQHLLHAIMPLEQFRRLIAADQKPEKETTT